MDAQRAAEEADIPLVEADYEYFARPGRDFSFLHQLAAESELVCKISSINCRVSCEQLLQGKIEQEVEAKEEDFGERRWNAGSDVRRASTSATSRKENARAAAHQNEGRRCCSADDRGWRQWSRCVDRQQSHKCACTLEWWIYKVHAFFWLIESADEEQPEPVVEQKKKVLKPMTTAELFLQRQKTLAELKARVASLCSLICEDPQQNVRSIGWSDGIYRFFMSVCGSCVLFTSVSEVEGVASDAGECRLWRHDRRTQTRVRVADGSVQGHHSVLPHPRADQPREAAIGTIIEARLWLAQFHDNTYFLGEKRDEETSRFWGISAEKLQAFPRVFAVLCKRFVSTGNQVRVPYIRTSMLFRIPYRKRLQDEISLETLDDVPSGRSREKVASGCSQVHVRAACCAPSLQLPHWRHQLRGTAHVSQHRPGECGCTL